MKTPFDWAAEGFRAPPTCRFAARGQILFRAWGGGSSQQGSPERTGVCFSSERPGSRAEAERLYAVFEWGNACRYVSDFHVPVGTTLWWGQVDPGDPRAQLGAGCGVQVFVENPAAQTLEVIRTAMLVDDLGGAWVHGGPRPGIDS